MESVTQRISKIKQPYGGYLPVKSFSKEVLDDGLMLNENENIHPSLVGLAVDYLTRFLLGHPIEKAFNISKLGATLIGMAEKADVLLSRITCLDELSITSACQIVGFDVCVRSSISKFKPVDCINPDAQTIENIRIMVERSLLFWQKYGPVICSKPTFEGGYTDTIITGDGDYLTADTLWDFKVSKSSPTSKHTLQILTYYIMGLHSIHSYYQNISNLGIFNPRLNTVYICPISSISAETISLVENDVICYNNPAPQTSYENIEKQNPITFTVSDICNMTGLKKSNIYADIRSGRLYATKKGNKYIISREDCSDYLQKLEIQREIQSRIAIGLVIFAIFAMLLLFFRTL